VPSPEDWVHPFLDAAIDQIEVAIEGLQRVLSTLWSARRRGPLPRAVAMTGPREPILVLLAVWPAPVTAQDEYHLMARSLTDGYHIPLEPSVIGQGPAGGAQSLTISVRIVPRGATSPGAESCENQIQKRRPRSAR